MHGQETQEILAQQLAQAGAPVSLTVDAGVETADVQATRIEGVAGTPDGQPTSGWDDSDSDSDYDEENGGTEDAQVEAVPFEAPTGVQVTTNSEPTSGWDDSDSDSDYEEEAEEEFSGTVQVSGNANSASEKAQQSEHENPPLEDKLANLSADDYAALLAPAKSPASDTNETAIDQSQFADFDSDNEAAHDAESSPSAATLANNFDHDNSSLIQQYYGSSQAYEQQEPQLSPRTRSRLQYEESKKYFYEKRPRYAVCYWEKLLGPGPACRDIQSFLPRSPNWKRIKTQNKQFSELPRLHSPLVPNVLALPQPPVPSIDIETKAGASPADIKTKTVSPPVDKHRETPKAKSAAFEEPRVAPGPSAKGGHRHRIAVCEPTFMINKLPLSQDELAALTGMDRDAGLRAGAEYRDLAKATSASSAQDVLNAQRLKLKLDTEQKNRARMKCGKPRLRNSDCVARLPQWIPQWVPHMSKEREKIMKGYLHEYHERLTGLQRQWDACSLRLAETERELRKTQIARGELQSALGEVLSELDEGCETRRADRTAHEKELRQLQDQHNRLVADAVQLEKERDAARDSLRSLQETYDAQTSAHDATLRPLQKEHDKLKAHVAQLEQELDEAQSAGHSLQDSYESQWAEREALIERCRMLEARMSDRSRGGSEASSEASSDAELADFNEQRESCEVIEGSLHDHVASSHKPYAARKELEAVRKVLGRYIVYGREQKEQLHSYYNYIANLERETHESKAQLERVVNEMHDAMERLAAEKAALETANANLEIKLRSRPPSIPETRTEPARWAERRRAWRRDPTWLARRKVYEQQFRQVQESRAEYEDARDQALNALDLPAPVDGLRLYNTIAGRTGRTPSGTPSSSSSSSSPSSRRRARR